ncbi:MAG: hypothetical protein IPG96_16335 [Proteobacteria bacterium]|nr:hypothetical protein [Pseudomonadota bacterium]
MLGDDAWGATTPPTGRFSSVGAGYYFSCGLRADTKAVACWGRNDYGQAVPRLERSPRCRSGTSTPAGSG